MDINLGLVAVIITVIIIIGAVITKQCLACMIVGSILASVFAFGKGFLSGWTDALQNMLADNVWVMLVCLLFGGLIRLLTDSKGSFGFAKYISRLCNTKRKTLITTFIMGILIFVDDYLNVLSIGTCMKRISDKQKLPRETLAYMLDSTGAPVCVLLPFSTWAVFYASLFFEQDSVKALGVTSGIQAYVKAIPFCFYPTITLIIVFLFAMGWFPKLGAMKKAYKRVEETGKVYSDASKKYNHDELENEEDGNIWNFLVPMVVLVAVTIISNDVLVAVVIALAVCFVMFVPRRLLSVEGFFASMIRGFGDMLPTLSLLLITFVLKDIKLDNIMIAYEPVWAIGTGKIPDTKKLEEILLYIKDKVVLLLGINPILIYGGSVNENTIEKLKHVNLIDGYLIGSASLNINSLETIIEVVK